MPQLADVQTFIDLSRQVTRLDELQRLMEDVTSEMGFDHFALVHHVDLRPLGTPVEPIVTRDFISLSNYPQAWMEQYVSDGIVSDDPVLLASQRTNVGFAWERIGELITLTPAHRALRERTRRAGIADGFTVPANVPGELAGSCNFAVGPGRAAPSESFAMAQLVGSFAFAAARDLVARLRERPDAPVKLTQRQLDCLVLVARGKSDWEIARILGLSEATVTTYIKRARELYDVPTRMQVVLRAVYEGAIPFSEIF